MILKSLYDYYLANQNVKEDGTGLSLFPKIGYALQNITFKLSLDKKGGFDAFDLAERKEFLPDLGALDIQKTSNPVAAYFHGTGKYVLGASCQDKVFYPYLSPERLEAFITLHEKIYKETKNKDLGSLLKFLSSIVSKEFKFSQIKPVFEKSKTGSGIIEISVGGNILHDQPDLKKYWETEVKNYKPFSGVCMVTGEKGAIRNLHGKVKLPGTTASGGSLISFNTSAHESYLRNGFPNVPISCKVEFGYRTVLNHLLKSDMNHSNLGGNTLVYWTNDHKENFFCNLIKLIFEKEDKEEEVLPRIKSSIELLRQGRKPVVELKNETFRLAILSANSGRIFVREFIEEPIKNMIEKVSQHCKDIALEVWTPKQGLHINSPTLQSLAWTSISPKAKNAKPPSTIYQPLLRAILLGEPYPINMVTTALSLCLMPEDKKPLKGTFLRMNSLSFLKAYLNRSYREQNKKEINVSLDTERTNIGYLLGRFLAISDHILSVSVGDSLNKNYSDRYRVSLGNNPLLVFKPIADKVSTHLSKIKKRMRGFGINLEKEYSEIFSLMSSGDIPLILSLEDRVEFVVGYQHQYQSAFKSKTSTQQKESDHE